MVSRLLHWLVAGGIVLQFVLGERAEEAAADGDLPGQLAALAQHKSIGITVLGLAVLRLIWRYVQPTPELTTVAPTLGERLARAMHIALYALLCFLPLSGWLMSSASGYSVAWFNLAQLPDLIGPSESAKEQLQTLHHWASKALLVLAIGHIIAALKHWLIDKDGVMGRMGSPSWALVFVAVIATGVAVTWPTDRPRPALPTLVAPVAPVAPVTADSVVATPSPQPTATQLPLWTVQQDNSHIRFTAQQAGADFTGEWMNFTADIRFATDDLENSSATVRMDAGGLETNDDERDKILAGLDWFDTDNFTSVVFRANQFEATATGFSTEATLQLRGVSYPIEFNFTVTSDRGTHTLIGTSRLDRLALNLGTLEWLDTDWVGQFVEVEVQVLGVTNG